MTSGETFESWGRYPKATHHVRHLHWTTDPLPASNGRSMLPFGAGRSYGDSCLNDQGDLLLTGALDHILAFDETLGLIRCEAGVTLDDLLKVIVPRGWFLPTTPGTKFITVGGAIANDIHGKNHHRAGSFGCHVTQFELLRSDGERRICSAEKNSDWFAATIGGLGLTGVITWAEFQLRRIDNAFLDTESLRFANLDEFFEIAAQSDPDFEYTVAWVDCLGAGRALGRGVFMRGNHAGPELKDLPIHRRPRLDIPIDFPNCTLNRLTIRAFNTLYRAKTGRSARRQRVHYDPFFYPLDAIDHWNRIYGSRGFFQYQFVVPFSFDQKAVRLIFEKIAASGLGSFLAVLKTFGDTRSPGLLSFPAPGITLALDFPNNGERTLALLAGLDHIVLAAGGRVYPAKDARMSAATFQEGFPAWQKFGRYVDPAFSSSFWRRTTQCTTK